MNHDPIGIFASIERCHSIYPWLVVLVSDWLFWDIEKHPGRPVLSRLGTCKGPFTPS